jgi:hypothetical protein
MEVDTFTIPSAQTVNGEGMTIMPLAWISTKPIPPKI